MFKKKRAVKHRFKITFLSASGLPEGSAVRLSWKRGAKSQNHGETALQTVENGEVSWNESVSILCTMFGTSAGAFEEKDLSLTLLEAPAEVEVSVRCVGEEPGGENFLPQLVGIIDPDTTFKALPSLFTPLDDTITILIGAMALGFVQIVTGMAISFVEKIKKGQIMDAIWEELTWWVVFAGIACMALGVTNIVLYVGLAMVVVGSGWSAKGFGKVTAIFGSVYNHVTGYFGDILSYSRLMTLMLAGSVIASVFNTLGAIPGNVVFFLIVSALGNGLNFALNLLSCYVHDLRLQCLEYFGKFYQDGGKPFEPLAINTKYVDIQS